MPNSQEFTHTHKGKRDLVAGWDAGWSVVNLRGNPTDPAFCAGVMGALGAPLPVVACSAELGSDQRIIWVGPDDWFVLSQRHSAVELECALRRELTHQHIAVTDVSSNYTVLHLSGPAAREVLAQGCPLDLHQSQFKIGTSAGSVFFKASVWLWQTEDNPCYEVLVRNSFMNYVWLMLEKCCGESRLVHRIFI